MKLLVVLLPQLILGKPVLYQIAKLKSCTLTENHDMLGLIRISLEQHATALVKL